MKSKIKGMFSPHAFASAAIKGLVALTVLALPGALSAQTLQHRYSFATDASDSVGGASWNGTLVGANGGTNATIANGLTLPGGGGPGYSGYVTFPAGILNTTTNLTIECWATENSGNTAYDYAELWNFNNGTGQYIGFIPYPGNNGQNMEAAFKTGGNETDAASPYKMAVGSEQYVVVTFNASTLVGTISTNGTQIASVTVPNSSYTPGTFNTANNVLGQDPWPDQQFKGTIYEFRIWNGVVSHLYQEVSAVAGPSVVINDLTPTAVSLTTETNLAISGAEQAVIIAQFPQVSNVPVTDDATNWVSSNPAVLTVNSNGVITAVALGSAKVSGTFAGITATSGTITVTPQTLVHRYSFISDASDSVGNANGTIVPPNGGAVATINNGLILPGNTQGGNGYSGYVALPQGVITNTTAISVECWLTQNNGNQWAEAWDFGINNQAYNFALIPDPADNGGHIEVPNFPAGNNINISSGSTFPNGSEQYVAVTVNGATLLGSLYTNGTLIATTTYPNISYLPGAYGLPGGTVNNYLGNDIYGDWQFNGTIYELRIWNGAVSPAYVAASAVAGPSVVVTNLTPTSLSISVNTSMIGAGTQQAAVVGNFLQAANVPLTGAATNWTSSNQTVLTVTSSGLITAVNGGTATISATVDGVTATSATITVATTPPIFSQKPSNRVAVVGDSVTFSALALGGNLSYQWEFNSTPITGATNTSLVLTNLSLGQAGTYTVAVVNNLGTTNASVTLSVSQAILEHRYSFVSDASDSIGNANGSIVPPKTGTAATINNGLILPGNTAGGFGYSGYVALPSGILTNTASITVECWVTQNSANQWATVWDFGSNNSQNFELCPFPQRNINNLDVAVEPNGGEIDAVTTSLFPSGTEQYVSYTFNQDTLVGNLYTNGVLGATATYPNATYIPGTIGGASGTTENMLGNDVFGDQQFSGTVYEFRIWDGAVSPLYLAVSEIAGPSVVVTNLTPVSMSVTVTNYNMVQGQSQSASVLANFVNASGISATYAVTNWSSSNVGVLTVDSNGVVTATGTGNATISATINGGTGTSSTINVANSAPVFTQEPPATENLLAGATLSVSVATIGTTPFTYYWFSSASPTPISVTTSPTLTLPNVQVADTASYTCLVSNKVNTTLSSTLNLTVVAPSTYDQAILTLNPIGYWPLNETSGNIAYDVVGGHNGTYTTTSAVGSSVTLNQSGPGNAFFGDSSSAAQFFSAYVDIPGAAFNITGPVTAMAWVQLEVAPGFDGLVGKGDNSWRTSINPSGEPGGNDSAGLNDATSTNSINDGNWHMVVYTYNGAPGQANNGALYVDGGLAANNTVPATPPGDNLDVWIGGSPDYGTARLLPAALISHVAVFNQALTAAQVQGLTNGVAVLGPQSIAIERSGANVVLTWQNGTLLQSTNLLGSWVTNSAAVSPYTVPATNRSQFFRLLVTP